MSPFFYSYQLDKLNHIPILGSLNRIQLSVIFAILNNIQTIRLGFLYFLFWLMINDATL